MLWSNVIKLGNYNVLLKLQVMRNRVMEIGNIREAKESTQRFGLNRISEHSKPLGKPERNVFKALLRAQSVRSSLFLLVLVSLCVHMCVCVYVLVND